MALDIQITDRDLPVLSAVASQALELVQREDVTTDQIEKLIRQDPSLTQRLLHTANSPFYSAKRAMQTIREAVVRLGMRQLRNVIVAAATGELFTAAFPWAQALWEHSLATAMASQALAGVLEVSATEEAFIAGMLHDVGKLVIFQQHPDIYRALCEEAGAAQRPVYELEMERFEFFTHMSVGGLVIRKWNLADTLAETARFHHGLDEAVPDALINPNLVCTVTLANALVHHLQGSPGGPPLEAIAEKAYARRVRGRVALLQEAGEKIAEHLQAQPARP